MSSKNRDRDVARQQQGQGQPSRGVIVSAQVAGYSGPLPPPDILQKYEEILPGSAERIVRAFETETMHRRGLEERQATLAEQAIPHELADRRSGLWMGFLVALAGFALSGYIVYKGHPITGVVGIVVEVAALATVFVTGRAIQGRREVQGEQQQGQLPPQR